MAKETTIIEIPTPKFAYLEIPISGATELICHNWSQKAIAEMLAKQQGKKVPRAHKDPQADYEASLYKIEDWYGFPAVAFKNAAVRAAQQFDIPMTTARQLFWVYGTQNNDFITINGEPKMREDVVRLNGKTADLRYRAGFMPWSTTLRVKINEQIIAASTVINLIAQAGFSVGIGEWRPERNGQYGCFTVAS